MLLVAPCRCYSAGDQTQTQHHRTQNCCWLQASQLTPLCSVSCVQREGKGRVRTPTGKERRKRKVKPNHYTLEPDCLCLPRVFACTCVCWVRHQSNLAQTIPVPGQKNKDGFLISRYYRITSSLQIPEGKSQSSHCPAE